MFVCLFVSKPVLNSGWPISLMRHVQPPHGSVDACCYRYDRNNGLQKGRVPSREEAEEEDIVSESEESEDSEEDEEGNGGKAAGKGNAQGQRERKPPAVKKGSEKGQQAKGGAGKAQADKQAKKPPAKVRGARMENGRGQWG